MKEKDRKEAVRASLFGSLRKVMSGLISGYLDDVETNSSIEPKVLANKFEDYKKQIIELQNKKKEELRLTKDEIIDTLKEAKKSVKELLSGKAATMDDLLGEFEFDDEDFKEFDEPGTESNEILLPEPEEKLNRFAMMMLFQIGSVEKEFCDYLTSNQEGVLDLVSRSKLVKTEPTPEPTPILTGVQYQDLAQEALDYVQPLMGEPPARDRKPLSEAVLNALTELDDVFNNDRIATTAVYAILYKVQMVYYDYVQRKNSNPEEISMVARMYDFVSNRVIPSSIHYKKFAEITKTILPSELDSLYLAMAWSFGLLNLNDRHPDLQGKLMAVVTQNYKED